MWPDHIIARLSGNTSSTVKELEEKLRGSYWKHESDRFSKGASVRPSKTVYYQFLALIWVGGKIPGQIRDPSNWQIHFKGVEGRYTFPLTHLTLLIEVTDESERCLVALMFL